MDENVITATGSIVLEYFADRAAEELSQMTLSAQRAVIFTDPGTLEEMAAWELDASRVRGVYLEGNVNASANDGDVHLRTRDETQVRVRRACRARRQQKGDDELALTEGRLPWTGADLFDRNIARTVRASDRAGGACSNECRHAVSRG